MEYSLQTLNKKAKLNELRVQEIIDKLNLIGLEVDDSFKEKLESNKYIDNLRLEIAIPSNREDLLNENLFLNELSTIFDFEVNNFWQKIKPRYYSLLDSKYKKSQEYKTEFIHTNLSSIINYNFHLKNIGNQKTPKWVKLKLKNSGINIDSLVLNNLINLSILEWGQHVNTLPICNGTPFQLERLSNATTFINNKNESILLQEGTIVLKNTTNKIISALGLVNIKYTNKKSSEYFLEATFYDIQENVLNLTTINTNLSYRYLRRNFLESFKFSLQRLLTLIELTTDIKVLPIKYINKNDKQKIKTNKILYLQKKSAKQILNILDYDLNIFKEAGLNIICQTNKELYFSINNSRRDLIREIDLIEEYSKFIGYKNFNEILPQKEFVYYKNTRKSEQLIKQFFINYGFNEVIANSIYDLNKIEKETIMLTNPLNKELSILRTSLIPNLINIFETNLRSTNSDQKFFEIGRTFKIFKNQIVEQEKLGAIFHFQIQKNSNRFTNEWFQAKGFMEGFFKYFNYENVVFEPINLNLSAFHPTRAVVIKANNIILGTFGEINPNYQKLTKLKEKVYICELNLNLLNSWKTNAKIITAKDFSKYPCLTKDISINVNKNIKFELLESVIRKNTSNIKHINFFDIYFDSEIKDSVNIAIRLEFQSNNETLRTEIIEQQIKNLLSILNTKFKI